MAQPSVLLPLPAPFSPVLPCAPTTVVLAVWPGRPALTTAMAACSAYRRCAPQYARSTTPPPHPFLRCPSAATPPPTAPRSAAAPSDEVVVPLKRASRIKKEKGKGFAEFTSRR